MATTPPSTPPGASGAARRAGLLRRGAAELVGTAALAAVVVGSGIEAGQLSQDPGLQLLAGTVATVLGLGVLLLLFGPLSGGHLNPVVTLTQWWPGRALSGPEAAVYLLAQTAGAIGGTVLADAMFARRLVAWSTHGRDTGHLLLGETVATAGLVLLINGLAGTGRGRLLPVAVACYVGAGIWFTSSGAFANPAVTIGRTFTDAGGGIAPASLPGFLLAQLLGAAIGAALAKLLFVGRSTPER